MDITPLYDRVLIRQLKKEERTPSGLVIPDVVSRKPNRGIVVRVGTGKPLPDGRDRALKVKKGDQVLFSRTAGDELVLDDVDHVLVKEQDLLAIVTE